MTHYLLDANHLSPLVTVNHPLRNRIRRRFEAGDRFSITAPVLSEFLFGIGSLPRSALNWREWELIRTDFGYYDIDTDVAEKTARLRLELRRQGWQVSLIDGLTAVVALRNDLILLTTDQDFRAVPNLKHENWRI